MNFRTVCYRAALLVSVFLAACGSPYLEKGFKTEADYEFAESANLSPIGVDRFKSVGVSNATQFKSALGEMQVTGYSKSNDVDDVLQFARDRLEGATTGMSASKVRDVRVAEAARLKAEKLEAERLAAKRKADKEAAEKAAAAEKAQAAAAEKAKRERQATAERLAKLTKFAASDPSMLEVVVDFQAFKGKKVVLYCDSITSFSAYGGQCNSGNQNISIDKEGIDKDFFAAALLSCPNGSPNNNRSSCKGLEIIGLVDGYSVPSLKNVRPYSSCPEGYMWVGSSKTCYEPTQAEIELYKSLKKLEMLLGG